MPVLNQIECHPKLVQTDLPARCRAEGILPQACSPLMLGAILKYPVVTEMAQRYARTPAQIVLRWDLGTDVVPVVRSSKALRLVENAAVFDFSLSQADVAALNALNDGTRTGPDPETFDMNIGFCYAD